MSLAYLLSMAPGYFFLAVINEGKGTSPNTREWNIVDAFYVQ